jgi:hypothetical protein
MHPEQPRTDGYREVVASSADHKAERSRLEIRLSVPLRVFLAGFGAIWCGFGLVIAVLLAASGHPAAVVPVLAVVLVAVVLIRLYRLAVMEDGADLIVRNFFRTYRLSRLQVRDFAAKRDGGASVAPHAFSIGWWQIIEARLVDGAVISLSATRRSILTPWAESKEVAGQFTALQGWRHPASVPVASGRHLAGRA